MKSNEFTEASKKGTYAGVHFSTSTKRAVKKYIKENNIPNPTPANKLHATLLYSRKYCPDYEAKGDLTPPIIGKPGEFQVWEGQPDKDGQKPNCLVMEFDCKELKERHEELMSEHDATHDYPEYKTHITFSYDIGELDHNDLPEFDGPIELVHEYQEDLDLDWASNNAKE